MASGDTLFVLEPLGMATPATLFATRVNYERHRSLKSWGFPEWQIGLLGI